MRIAGKDIPLLPIVTLPLLALGPKGVIAYVAINAAYCVPNTDTDEEEAVDAHFIDIGHGDAILIDYGTKELLIDGGKCVTSTMWGNIFQNGCIAMCEREHDIVRAISGFVDGALDVVVATHPDSDHIGGLVAVLNAFDVGEMWFNGETKSSKVYQCYDKRVASEGTKVHVARRGDQIHLGDLTFNVLHPASLGDVANNNSIVLELFASGIRFLFMGDAEEGAEWDMLFAGLIRDIDVLKVGHHGSKNCSSEPFLNIVRPGIAVYSAGENSYGHPEKEAIDRLKAVGARVYGTDEHGTIVVTADGKTKTCRVQTER